MGDREVLNPNVEGYMTNDEREENSDSEQVLIRCHCLTNKQNQNDTIDSTERTQDKPHLRFRIRCGLALDSKVKGLVVKNPHGPCVDARVRSLRMGCVLV
jgi:hypothetical protein